MPPRTRAHTRRTEKEKEKERGVGGEGEGGSEGRKEEGREEGREGGWEGGREGGREEGRERGRERGREGEREGGGRERERPQHAIDPSTILGAHLELVHVSLVQQVHPSQRDRVLNFQTLYFRGLFSLCMSQCPPQATEFCLKDLRTSVKRDLLYRQKRPSV